MSLTEIINYMQNGFVMDIEEIEDFKN